MISSRVSSRRFPRSPAACSSSISPIRKNAPRPISSTRSRRSRSSSSSARSRSASISRKPSRCIRLLVTAPSPRARPASARWPRRSASTSISPPSSFTPKESAACATRDGTWWVPGPYAAKPLITTGAGDHFNAGFTAGQLIGLSPEACLAVGVCTSGHYVRTAQSPTHADLETFLTNWN
ncbi:MAG: carbohydrate kinase family protein [Opitutus sp.]|nr:carbohydrate kinase family protein [Opitutus sp.]